MVTSTLLAYFLLSCATHVSTKPAQNFGYGPSGDPTTTIDYDLADFDEFGLDPVTPAAVDFVGITDSSGNADSAAAEPHYGGSMFDANPDPFSTGKWNMQVSTTTTDTTADVSIEEPEISQSEGGPTDEGKVKSSNKSKDQVDNDTVGNDGDEMSAISDKQSSSKKTNGSSASPEAKNTTTGGENAGTGGSELSPSQNGNGENLDPDNDKGIGEDTERYDVGNKSSNTSSPKGNSKGSGGYMIHDESSAVSSGTSASSSETSAEAQVGSDSTGSASLENSASHSAYVSSNDKTEAGSASTSQSASGGGGTSSSSSSESMASLDDQEEETGGQRGGMSSGESSSSGSSQASKSSESRSSEEISRVSSSESTSAGDSMTSSESAQSGQSGRSDGGWSDQNQVGSIPMDDNDSDEVDTLDQCFDPFANQHDLCKVVRALNMVCLLQFPSDCSNTIRRKRSLSSDSGSVSAGNSANSFKYSAPSMTLVSSESPDIDSPFSRSTEVSDTSKSSHTSSMSLESLTMESISASFERSQSVAEVMAVIKSLCPAICAASQSPKNVDDDFDSDGDFDDIESDSRDEDDSTAEDSDESTDNSLENYTWRSKESDESNDTDEPESAEDAQDTSDDNTTVSDGRDSPESPESVASLTLDDSLQSTSTETTGSDVTDSGTAESDGGGSSDNNST